MSTVNKQLNARFSGGLRSRGKNWLANQNFQNVRPAGIRISARGANLVFGPGEGRLLETGRLFSFSNKK